MACFYPLEGWRSRRPSSGGKFPITFKRDESNGQPLVIACGQCIGCRLDRSKEWSLRIMHEAQTTEEDGQDSCFLTLTYDDEHLPEDLSLHHQHFQLFLKRLRKKIAPLKIRFYMCGEYGEKYGRPHYHAIIFGYAFPDRYSWYGEDGKENYRSEELEKIWTMGNSLIGPCNIKTAGYCARYIMKKAIGENADEVYKVVGLDGRFHPVKHEYTAMSTSPGLGSIWYERYKSDTEKDFITFDGRKYKIPKYYDKLLEADDSKKAKAIKAARRLKAREHEDNNTVERLRVREHCTKERALRLVRNLE